MSSSDVLLSLVRHRMHNLYDLRTFTGYEASLLLTHLSLTHATLLPTPTLTCHLTVHPSLCNAGHYLHGGATATIFDVVTTLAVWLVAREEEGGGEGFWMHPGVSRDLHVVYLDGVREGERVEVVGEVVRVGRRLCQLRGVMRRVGGHGDEDGRVVATCEHGKVSLEGKL